MLKIKYSILPKSISKLISTTKDTFTILPVEGVNKSYYADSEKFSDILKISFVFSKRIFLEDNIFLEKNDTFADIIFIDNNLSEWFKLQLKNKLKEFEPQIIEVPNAFELFMHCLELIKSEIREFNSDSKKIVSSSSIIHNNVEIGNNVYIGPKTVIYPNVVIYDNVYIGSNVIIHSNSVIGADGFGYTNDITKIPQEGGVVIKDHTEIGACTCIDRATIGYTYIGKNTKIDNLVQIGHNVKIGENCRIAGKSGIAGSARIYHNSIIGAMSGVKDGIKIGPNSILAGASMATKHIPPNQTYAGNPARPFIQHFKEIAKRS